MDQADSYASRSAIVRLTSSGVVPRDTTYVRRLAALEAGRAVAVADWEMPESYDARDPVDGYARIEVDGSLTVLAESELTEADLDQIAVM